ncbi:accessory gene regulator B family protein [Paenibacillus sp. GCM10023248]|uniref:accessory gene regulator B family protein n=1 Tax=unclassified Paenibacillus TaxID=185978 RepID=UPI002379C6DB|nr:accessory gene regulator B family protein [Paenibacillus sp. MAHUQ-63]MDD9266016.1 accessory gene regulator B family protein [Paenibacillus sp. MAHUQ-63]
MISVEKTANYIAQSINKYDSSRSVTVMAYILKPFLNVLVTIAYVLIIAALTSHFLDALSCVWAFPLLRHISGGMHFKSNTVCNIISSLFILTSVYSPVIYWNTGFIINIIAIMILLIWAPNGVSGTMDPKNYPLLKGAAILIVSTNFLFQSHILSVAFLIQAITTIPISQKVIHKLKL